MSKFIKKCFLFIAFFVFVSSIITFLTSYHVSHKFKYKIDKNILILGDSHTQCGLNDSIISNSLNLSESADTYFYSYIKLKKIITFNKQIDTLILGYSLHNITSTEDSWLKDSSINSFKLPLHFFLFENQDLWNFYKINKAQTFRFFPSIIKKNLSIAYRINKNTPINKFGIGGFNPLNHYFAGGKAFEANHKGEIKFSTIDIDYLKKIYLFCEENKIKLLLVNMPTYNNKLYENDNILNYYKTFKEKELKNASLLNYSNIIYDKKYFADNAHLNKYGAIKFSTYFDSIKRVKISTREGS